MPKHYERASMRARARPRRAPHAGRYRYVRRRWTILFACLDWCGWLIARLIARRRGCPARPNSPVRSILLIQLDHLGDAVLTSAVLPALRERFPSARIDVLAATWNQEIFAACPSVDRIFVSGRNRFARGGRGGWMLATIWWGWRLRRERYDLAIDVRGEAPLALLAWLSGAKRRLGWRSGGGDFLLTDSVAHAPGRSEVESRLALLKVLGISASPRRPWLDPGVGARQRIDRWLGEAPTHGRPLVALHVGAGSLAKRWPVHHWRELLGRLIVQHDARVALLGGPADASLAQAITEGRDWPGVTDWTGQLSVLETAAVIERADVFVGGDSGPAHLSAAVGTPVVAIFSGTNDARQWRPWGDRVEVVQATTACSPCHRQRCPWADHPCMWRIEPELVLDRVVDLLSPRIVVGSRDELRDWPELAMAWPPEGSR